MLSIYLREPCNEPARWRAAATLTRQARPASPDRARLAHDRDHAAAHADQLAARLVASLAERGIPVTRACTAGAAADHITRRAGGTTVAITGGAVLAELSPALAERGVEIVPTYGPGATAFQGRHQRFWQLPPRELPINWRTQAVDADCRERRDVVGLFGANAVSAATGSIYLVQHSNNIGDLLRAARLLIFVVGIDKITADDAAARRQAEAVSAFGTDTVLLDLSRTAPVGSPLDRFPVVPGPAATEVVLLDNGRLDLLKDQYRSLFTCIGCRACATRCPTYPFFRGPGGWSPKDYLWSHLRGDNPSLDLCTLCGNCEVDCPLDIPLPELIARRRADVIRTRGRGLSGWRRRVQGDVEHLCKIFSATAPVSNRAPEMPLAPAVMEKVFGLSAQRRLPVFRKDTFERWYAEKTGEKEPSPQPAPASVAGEGEETPARERGQVGQRGARRRVVYYFGCFANYNNPEVGQAAVEILEALGYEVTLPTWRCCGIPLYAKGEIAAARQLASTNIASLAAYVGSGYEVVTTCPSCQLALARDYPRLFPSEPAERVAAHTHFLSRFLLDDGRLQARAAETPRAAYHLPCHLRAQGLDGDSIQLLEQTLGMDVTNLGRGCCGLSGTFGLERAHYAESMDIGAGVFGAVGQGDFDVVLTDCGACKLQIEHGTGRKVMHPLEVLCRAALRAREEIRPRAAGNPNGRAAAVLAPARGGPRGARIGLAGRSGAPSPTPSAGDAAEHPCRQKYCA